MSNRTISSCSRLSKLAHTPNASLHWTSSLNRHRNTNSKSNAANSFEMMFVCTPVDTVPAIVADCVQKFPDAIVSDIGSTKSEIVSKTDRLLAGCDHRFVAGHPIAGGDTTGPITPPNSIFTDKLFVSTPSESTDLTAVEQIERLWRALDCRTIRLEPDRT